METADFERRFSGTGRLYGASALQRFRSAHVCVVGIGGVGTWAAEALARSAIGQMTLVDLDMIAESNVNRQIHALGDAFGRAKVSAMAERIRAINPSCAIAEVENFVTPDNVAALLEPGFDAVIDAIDDSRAKVALIAACRDRGIPIVCSGAAGARVDPTLVACDDLARTVQDSLLARVRQRLRKEHGFPRDPKRRFGVTAVFSRETVRPPTDPSCAPTSGGLACSGYGSTVCVTGAFGFAGAAAVLRLLASKGSD